MTKHQRDHSSHSAALSQSTSNNDNDQQLIISKLRQKCQELQQVCKDKDEQLKAVSNNQTILHTSLRAAVAKLEKKVATLQETHQATQTKSAAVLEKLLLAAREGEAKEVRQKLAHDSARVGRIIYTRAGMRAVEGWEEGHAAKALQQKYAELQAQKQVLEERKKRVLAKNNNDKRSDGQDADQSHNTNDAMAYQDSLSVLEAEESVRLHLYNLSKREKALSEEKQALGLERGRHIRNLKRAAAEDESRFRSRPKVRLHRNRSLTCLCRMAPFLHLFLLLWRRRGGGEVFAFSSGWAVWNGDGCSRWIIVYPSTFYVRVSFFCCCG